MRVIKELWLQRRRYPPRWIFQVERHLQVYAGALQRAKAMRDTLCVIRHTRACRGEDEIVVSLTTSRFRRF